MSVNKIEALESFEGAVPLFQPHHLYTQVRDELARRIANGEFPPGSLLPNEFVLSKEMHVSVGTLRKAVEMLVTERLVQRKQGRGTTVADPKSPQFRDQYERIRNSDGSPIPWKLKDTQVEVRAAGTNEIDALRLDDTDEIIAVSRVCEAYGKVAKLETSCLPRKVFGEIDFQNGQGMTVERLAFLHGLQINGWEERVTIALPPSWTAKALGVSENLPILRLERLIYDRVHRPVEWRIAYCEMTGRQYRASSADGGLNKLSTLNFPSQDRRSLK